MKKIIPFVIGLSFIFVLTSWPSDKKLANKIQDNIQESAGYEVYFLSNQARLNEVRKNTQLVYNDLISLHFNDKQTIEQKIDIASEYIKEQQILLEEAESDFQKAFEKIVKAEKYVEKINDDNQQKQAKELISIMNTRKVLIDSYIEDYQKNLETQHTFYQELKTDNINIMQLDEYTKGINERNDEMEETIQEYNLSTKQYTEIKREYMQMT